MIPLYGFLEGDTMGLLVLAEADETLAALAKRLEESAGARVAPRPPLWIFVDGRQQESELTVAEAGLTPHDRFDVRHEAAFEGGFGAGGGAGNGHRPGETG